MQWYTCIYIYLQFNILTKKHFNHPSHAKLGHREFYPEFYIDSDAT